MAVLPAIAAGWFAFVASDRAGLPYNSQGRYFDAEEGVTYTDSAPLVYGVLAALFGLLAVGLWMVARRRAVPSAHIDLPN